MLLRRLWPLALAYVFVISGAACTANIEEGCLSGECSPPGKPNVPSNSTSSGDGGGGGGGGAPCEMTPATGDFPCDVFMALQTNCHSCHQNPPMNGAPFSLLTYEDTRLLNGNTTTPRWKRMGEVVTTGFMPLGKTITPEDKQLILDWVAGCALPAETMGCE